MPGPLFRLLSWFCQGTDAEWGSSAAAIASDSNSATSWPLVGVVLGFRHKKESGLSPPFFPVDTRLAIELYTPT
jgi:hypothetical protein